MEPNSLSFKKWNKFLFFWQKNEAAPNFTSRLLSSHELLFSVLSSNVYSLTTYIVNHLWISYTLYFRFCLRRSTTSFFLVSIMLALSYCFFLDLFYRFASSMFILLLCFFVCLRFKVLLCLLYFAVTDVSNTSCNRPFRAIVMAE